MINVSGLEQTIVFEFLMTLSILYWVWLDSSSQSFVTSMYAIA
jgi:hypothetical protein